MHSLPPLPNRPRPLLSCTPIHKPSANTMPQHRSGCTAIGPLALRSIPIASHLSGCKACLRPQMVRCEVYPDSCPQNASECFVSRFLERIDGPASVTYPSLIPLQNRDISLESGGQAVVPNAPHRYPCQERFACLNRTLFLPFSRFSLIAQGRIKSAQHLCSTFGAQNLQLFPPTVPCAVTRRLFSMAVLSA